MKIPFFSARAMTCGLYLNIVESYSELCSIESAMKKYMNDLLTESALYESAV